jgi:hypothetical protein
MLRGKKAKSASSKRLWQQWYQYCLLFLAELTGTTTRDTSNQHPVALFEILNFLPDLLNYADAFVAQSSSWCACRDVAFQDVKVGAADGSPLHLHQGIKATAQPRNLLVYELALSDSIVDERFHGWLRCCSWF